MIRRKIILAILAAACAAFLLIGVNKSNAQGSIILDQLGGQGNSNITIVPIPFNNMCSATYNSGLDRIEGCYDPTGNYQNGMFYISIPSGATVVRVTATADQSATAPSADGHTGSFLAVDDNDPSGSNTEISHVTLDWTDHSTLSVDTGTISISTTKVGIEAQVKGTGYLRFTHVEIAYTGGATSTPINTATQTPIPCGGFLCITPASFAPVCTVTPISTASNTPTQQFVNSTHVFPTVAPFPTIHSATPNSTFTVTPGPSPTLFQTSTVTASPGLSPTITPTTQCIPGNYTPIVNYNEHDIPGGACYRLFPPIGFVIDALVIPIVNWTILPQITIIVHPVDFCYTTFVLDVSFAGVDLWSWLEIIFDIILAAWSASTILTGQ